VTVVCLHILPIIATSMPNVAETACAIYARMSDARTVEKFAMFGFFNFFLWQSINQAIFLSKVSVQTDVMQR
jgi:hypothetical protein